MKGIRKLFLGLVFLTLFSVGFKVDVKAWTEYVGWVNGTTHVDVPGDATGVLAEFFLEPDDFPTSETAEPIVLSVESKLWDGTKSYNITNTKTSTGYQYVVNDGTTSNTHTLTSLPAKIQVTELDSTKTKSSLRTLLAGKGEGEYTYSFKVGSVEGVRFFVRVFKVTPAVLYNGGTEDIPAVTFSDTPNGYLYNGSFYLFDTESDIIKATLTDGKPEGMKYGNWLKKDKTSTGITTDQTYTILTSDITASYSTTIYANYEENKDATPVITPSFVDAYLAEGFKTSEGRKFKFGSGTTYTGQNISSAYFEKSGGDVSVIGLFRGTGKEGYINFTVPAGVGTGKQKLVIHMDDGFEYVYDVNIVNPTIEIAPATNNITVGETSTLTATVSPSLPGTITYEFFGITPTTYDQYIKATTSGNKFNFEGIKETTTGVKVRARAKVPVEGMENTWIETDAATGSATINVTSPTFITLGTVYANEGLNVNLAKFINNGSGGGVNVTTVSSSGGYISNETTLPALAKNVNLKGKKSGTNTNDVRVTASGTEKTANVVVYPKPTLSVSDSGSGSSLKYTFKLTVPKAVYDGTTVISDVDKAVLEFKGKKDTYVYDESISLESDGDLKKKNKDTISIDIKKLTEIFDKVCEDDSEEVKVTTYVKGDKNCISDEHKIHVYKIKLDGSAGADYKINGESKSDKFYAIKDKTYEISTTPKSGYNGTPTKWDGTSFGTASSGSTSFSESKTVKAYYTGGSSSSSSSSRQTANNSAATGDDYDDVPKTGESKADIWILWSVLFISILGAGFMIWKRFGLVRAIAEAEEEAAIAEREERIEAEAKEKQEKIDMLKNLRNL